MDEGSGAQRGSGRVVALILGVGVVVGVLVGLAVVAWPFGTDAEASVRMLPAADQGADPFTDSVQIAAVPAVAPAAAAAVGEVQRSMPRDQESAVLVATGTAPGLYGGTGDTGSCDPAALVAFLKGHPDKATAWSKVLGITTDRIETYVAGLTPVVLTTDTLVTNHGFRDGHATEMAAVLQAGTAVMVDARGVPRVKCNCGNPLTEPTALSIGDASRTGQTWDGFDARTVAVVRPGQPVEELTICNLRTGERYTTPVGSATNGGSPPPNLDGTWTITLTRDLMSTEPLRPGSLDPTRCPDAGFDGATMVVHGRRASVTLDGNESTGTVDGAPAGSQEWLTKVQQATKGAVIRFDGTSPGVEIIVATGADDMFGGIDTVDARGIGTGGCKAGVIIRRAGTGPAVVPTTGAPSTAPPRSTVTTSPSRATVAPSTTAPAARGGPCDQAKLTAAFVALGGGEYKDVQVTACDGRWAVLTVIRPDLTEDYPLLEWNGSAWQGGACERYRDPNDWTKSKVVPSNFWHACIVD